MSKKQYSRAGNDHVRNKAHMSKKIGQWSLKNQLYLAEQINFVQRILEFVLHSHEKNAATDPKRKGPIVARSKTKDSEDREGRKGLTSSAKKNGATNYERRQDLSRPISNNIAGYYYYPVAAPQANKSSPALETIVERFGLSDFERLILIMCAGVELKTGFADLCAKLNGDENMRCATLEIALATFPQAHWDAVTPISPLRKFRLIDLIPHGVDPLVRCPIRIEEAVLHYLAGMPLIDKRLETFFVRGLEKDEDEKAVAILPSSHKRITEKALQYYNSPYSSMRPSCVHLWGSDRISKESIIKNICRRLGITLSLIYADCLPTKLDEFDVFADLWSRESILNRKGLLINADNISNAADHRDNDDTAAAEGNSRIVSLLVSSGRLKGPLFLSTESRWPFLDPKKTISIEVKKPSKSEQRGIWRAYLEDNNLPRQVVDESTLSKIIDTFDYNTTEIFHALKQTVSSSLNQGEQFAQSSYTRESQTEVGEKKHSEKDSRVFPELDRSSSSFLSCSSSSSSSSPSFAMTLWNSCRNLSEPKVGSLASKIVPRSTLDDLVLPKQQLLYLKWIVAHVRNRQKVYEEWGFGEKYSRGLGIAALFEGQSGTGKTMAAEALASELNLNLVHIDLSNIVSKYIGETEKNLHRVFDAAEVGGSILFFDEADALFGKRSEVRDSHDRYANIEVGYLLQRMEQYRGLAILATNMRAALDPAFIRRMRFIIKFPFPNETDREEIWRRVFPKSVPLKKDVDFRKLAILNVTGGNIRNIALNASFLAAERNVNVDMAIIAEAAKFEYEKLGKSFSAEELGSGKPHRE